MRLFISENVTLYQKKKGGEGDEWRLTFGEQRSPAGSALPSPENQATQSLAKATKRSSAVHKAGSSSLSFVTVGLDMPLVPANVPVSCCYCSAVLNTS